MAGTHVGEPGGLLHHLKVGGEGAEAEAGLINGALVVLSQDG